MIGVVDSVGDLREMFGEECVVEVVFSDCLGEDGETFGEVGLRRWKVIQFLLNES